MCGRRSAARATDAVHARQASRAELAQRAALSSLEVRLADSRTTVSGAGAGARTRRVRREAVVRGVARRSDRNRGGPGDARRARRSHSVAGPVTSHKYIVCGSHGSPSFGKAVQTCVSGSQYALIGHTLPSVHGAADRGVRRTHKRRRPRRRRRAGEVRRTAVRVRVTRPATGNCRDAGPALVRLRRAPVAGALPIGKAGSAGDDRPARRHAGGRISRREKGRAAGLGVRVRAALNARGDEAGVRRGHRVLAPRRVGRDAVSERAEPEQRHEPGRARLNVAAELAGVGGARFTRGRWIRRRPAAEQRQRSAKPHQRYTVHLTRVSAASVPVQKPRPRDFGYPARPNASRRVPVAEPHPLPRVHAGAGARTNTKSRCAFRRCPGARRSRSCSRPGRPAAT